jgi:histidine kinase
MNFADNGLQLAIGAAGGGMACRTHNLQQRRSTADDHGNNPGLVARGVPKARGKKEPATGKPRVRGTPVGRAGMASQESRQTDHTIASLEEEIKRSDERYRLIFNNIPNPVFVLDRKSLRIIDCNDSVRDVYGYSREDLVNSSFLNFFEEAEHQNYALELRNSDVLNHVRQGTRDGRSIFVNMRVSPFDYQGRRALLVACSDVIRVLVIKEQLVQASKMATLGEMATGIAHELNQPLSVIKTASSFLLSWLEKGQEVDILVLGSMVEEIDSHVDRAAAIINHIREFGRKSEARREPVQINQALDRALDIFSQQLRVRDIEVVKGYQLHLPPVMADSNRLEQVFINLLINARDAIEEKRERLGGGDAPGTITVTASVAGNRVRVEIRDSGIGIPSSHLDKIFEPFFTTKPVGRGTGLGLSISYGIVQEFQGSMHVESVEHEGANFILQFPL